MRTKGAKGKKTVVKVAKVIEEEVAEIKEEKLLISEIAPFGNEDMIKLVLKVNEIIKFINK